MKVVRIVFRFLFLSCALFISALSHGQQQSATLVFTADLPVINSSEHGDYAQLARLIETMRQEDPSTFFLFGGGSLAPSHLSSFDRGAHIIDILNSIEPDAMSVTKREFSYFEDEFSLRAYEAAFPMVLSNAFDPFTQGNVDGANDSVLIEKGGITIGILSVIHESVIEEYLLQRLQITDPYRAIKTEAAKLREQGAQLVVLMYSSSYPFIDSLLSDSTINVALRTDPHYELSAAKESTAHPNRILVNQAGVAAILDLTWPTDKPNELSISWRNQVLETVPKDPVINHQIRSYTQRIERLLNEELATTSQSFDTLRPSVRTQESAFGNLVTDALREAAQTDIAIINGGAIRGEKQYQSDAVITRRDIAEELPFRSRIMVVEVTGTQLLLALENGLSQIEGVKGRFLQMSGVEVVFDGSKPIGSRLLSATVAGKRVKPDEKYTVAMSDYLAKGGDGFAMFSNAKRLGFSQQVTPLISDIVISYFRKKQSLTAMIEGRIRRTDTPGAGQ